jgi:sterol desaturase/sphingolipid hydroxylase (fatty acid hydroxylase superfamily)
MQALLTEVLGTLRATLELSAYSAVFYISLALLVKGQQAIQAGRRAMSEIRVNLAWLFFNALCAGPAIAVAVAGVRFVVKYFSLEAVDELVWLRLGTPAVFLLVVFLGDFGSYWRHRFEHTRWVWPAHAIHHSDTHMTWLTLERFHPVNYVVTNCVDTAFLAILGFPAWALVANQIVRHYYGEFIHSDLPWTYGPLRGVFVSPAMHQWHHARDVDGAGSNFATVFSVFDRWFGTYHVPGPCDVPLGVNENVGTGLVRQLMYPFVRWFNDMCRFVRRRTDTRSVSVGSHFSAR